MRKHLGYTLIIIGVVMVIVKVVDFFIADRVLIPFLTLISFILIMFGLYLITRHKIKKHEEGIKNGKVKKAKKKNRRKKVK